MDSTDEARLLKLLEIEEIKQIKYRYMRYMMLGEIEAMGELFTEDVKAEYSDGKYSFEGKDSLLKFLRGTHAPDSGMRSIWMMGHPEIEITGEDTATGIWFFTHLTINQKEHTNLAGQAIRQHVAVEKLHNQKIDPPFFVVFEVIDRRNV